MHSSEIPASGSSSGRADDGKMQFKNILFLLTDTYDHQKESVILISRWKISKYLTLVNK